jgi:hypothetical protein
MRFCFSQAGCTELIGAAAAYKQAQKIAPTSQQRAILHRLFILSPTFYETARAPLLATKNALSYQLGIPSDHWEVQVQAWLHYLLAVTQTSLTHIAAGPGIVRPDFDELAEPLQSDDVCSTQRMGAPDGYSNINVFELALVIGLCSLIIIFNMSLVPTSKYLHHQNPTNSPRVKSWIQDGILQIQRKVFEAAGYSGWLHRESTVPVLKNNEPVLGFGGEVSVSHVDGVLLEDLDSTRQGGSPLSLAASSHSSSSSPTPAAAASSPPVTSTASSVSHCLESAPPSVFNDFAPSRRRNSANYAVQQEPLTSNRRRRSSAPAM